jgi:nitroreductase
MINTILNHKSIRKYSEKKIENNILNRILQAGIRASNTGNMQAYAIIVTQEKSKKK